MLSDSMFIDIQGLHLHYKLIGNGFPLLIIHGWRGNMGTMEAVFELLFTSNSDIKRVYIDLPGMGDSTSGSYLSSTDDVLEELFDFIDKVIGAPFLIAGYSYGGYLARAIVDKKPSDILGLFLLAPMLILETKGRKLQFSKWFELTTEYQLAQKQSKQSKKSWKNVDQSFIYRLKQNYRLKDAITNVRQFNKPI